MVEGKQHKCCTCGYIWDHGKHGGHSCSDRLSLRIKKLEAALQRIGKWQGEFPATGKTWPGSDRPMSYGSYNGSNGERDYMRNVALKALEC